MNTLKINAAIIKDFNKSKDNVGMKDYDTDIYECLSFEWHSGLICHEAWVFAPILNKDIKVKSKISPLDLKPKALQKIRGRAHKLLVSMLAKEYCQHPWFGKEKQ